MTSKKKIGFVLTSSLHKGGISRVLSIISNELCEFTNYEIHIISFYPSVVSGYTWNKKIIFHDLLTSKVGMKRGILPASKKLRRLLKKHEIDILVLCGHNVGLLSILSSFFLRTKLVYWPHSSFSGYKLLTKYLNERINAAFVNVVVTLTKADKTNFLQKTLARNVVQIYNPIDPELDITYQKYNPNTKKILSVGRLNEEKNFHSHLIEIAKIVLSKHEDYEWHIYGSGEYHENIQIRINENKLAEKVKLMGHKSDIYSIYGDYSLLVMTSQFEGFPMTLLEGMSKGLPLLSFDVPTGPNEIIMENKNGFLIPPFDIHEMANKICLLIENTMTRNEFSKENKNFVKEFNIKKIGNKWVSLFESLI
ncbi:glycosyltransferase family 4 protein [Maribacter luteus]|uniref:Glycosyltransferase n=1 Tax=Maribacter luteus TaxID=2594478 RepID=A0A6I2MJ96_9FLAO|nr:glycosyltransferase family 4 protein [Maribacter luteus]MRX63768.1 glycosyltransferase [Maribacter luteus]